MIKQDPRSKKIDLDEYGDERNSNIVEAEEAKAFDEKDLISNDDIDTIIISATPETTHYPMALASLQAGKNVFLEKPIATTLEEAEETIMLKAKEYLINPFVLVKLANFEITILGEVTIPGRYPVYKEGITIYEALAMAGDINDYGNLQEVKMIRSNKNKKEVYYLDLTDADILTSDFYYLHNNDLILLPFEEDHISIDTLYCSGSYIPTNEISLSSNF